MAALVVLIYHVRNVSGIGLEHGYLAVDLFFVLSGFVLAGVYTPRFASGMTLGSFLLARARRLYPLFAAGMLLGMAVYAVMDWKTAAISGGLGLALIPWPGREALFHVNPPSWSLLDEILINIALALYLWKAPSRVLCIIILISALALSYAQNIFGKLDGGPYFRDYWVGWARVCYSFPVGMLLYRVFVRLNLERFRINQSWLGAALPILCCIAFIGWNDLMVVLIIFPVFVIICASVEPRLSNVYSFLGDISYPLYCIQFPLIQVVAFFARKSGHPLGASLIGIAAILIASWLAMRIADYLTAYAGKRIEKLAEARSGAL